MNDHGLCFGLACACSSPALPSRARVVARGVQVGGYAHTAPPLRERRRCAGAGGGGGGGGMGGIAIFLALLAHCPPHAACNLFAEGHSSSKNSRTAPPTSPGCRACSEVRVLTRPSSLLRSKRQAGSLARTASKRGQPERSASKPDRSQTSTTDRKR